ncbi:MAG: Cytochrome c family protein [uncultured Thiotrichaceae bacterium]|uniref:Cytochrome c family protein n=1 Tax=uncultured Thiotrichaceae bacterium TaxID=298394 RepID=A0A6S6U011_9GAMM|nr:MAG: Cytochrome c family protein [uncultured Thiotrichaceae bacterium]
MKLSRLRLLRLASVSLLIPLFAIAFAESPTTTSDSTTVNTPIPTAPHEVSSQVCGSCHVEIFNEWKGSMHAQSTPMADPIHDAFYRKVIGDPKEEGVKKKGKYPVCLKCHAPNAAMQKKTKLDAKPAFAEGVNCVYCHTISGYKGTTSPEGKQQLGQAAYVNSTTSLQSPSGKNYTTSAQATTPGPADPTFHPFPMEGKHSAIYKSNEICLGCHDQRKNFNGVALCNTGNEYADSGSQVNCQSCHMPMVNGHASHNWAGGHDKNMLRKSLKMQLHVDKADANLKAIVTMKNLLPHNFPTGSPFRNAYLKLVAYNEQGEVVWQNYKTHPMKEDKDAVMYYTLGDGAGKPAMPPKAKEVLSDTRLKPHEERVMEYKIQGEGITLVRAEVFYHLLTPKLAESLDKVLTADLKETKRVALSEVKL